VIGNTVITPFLLSPREAAKALSISERTLATLTKNGVIPAVRFPGSRLVRYSPDAIRETIIRLQASMTNGQPAPANQ
jgi:excisionase family DNA binding protein